MRLSATVLRDAGIRNKRTITGWFGNLIYHFNSAFMSYYQRPLTGMYERITAFVIEQLEKGEVIWNKEWNVLGLPKNISNGHVYKGWNSFFLNFITMSKGYRAPYFITFKQAMHAGGRIGKGQNGYQVIWWATIEIKSVAAAVDGEDEYHTCRIPRFHTVFNIDQTQGIVYPKADRQFRSEYEKIDACEKIIASMPQRPAIVTGGDQAYYDRKTDRIYLPPVERFHSNEAYYKTLFHELAHSTGHVSRLNRLALMQAERFGNEQYSKEELTAELTASFICAVAGIGEQTINNSTAYIQGWLKVLKDDKFLILRSAKQAQAAASYILNDATHIEPALAPAMKGRDTGTDQKKIVVDEQNDDTRN
jgi:antirestriction protein ArdC